MALYLGLFRIDLAFPEDGERLALRVASTQESRTRVASPGTGGGTACSTRYRR